MTSVSTWVVVMAMMTGCAVDQPVGQSDQMLTGSGSGGTGSGSGAGVVWHSTMNGGGASASMWNGMLNGYVSAYEQGNGANRVASLNFMFQGPDPASQVCYTWSDPYWGTYSWCYYTAYLTEWGWGTIPSADFTVSANAGTARLHTTTDPTTFQVQKCSYSWMPWWGWGNCTFNTSESFDLAWNKDGFSSFSHNGTTESTWGAFTSRSSGRYVQNSATMTGTGAGQTFTNASGAIQDSMGTSVTREIVNAGP